VLRPSLKLVLIIGVFFWNGSPPFAAEAPTPSKTLSITSKSMTVKNMEHLAVFDGDVVMIKEDMTITSRHAEVTFASKDDTAGNSKSSSGLISPQSQFSDNEVTLIHATGDVVLKQGEKEAKSKEAFYYQKEDKVILLGDPVAWEKDTKITGTKMTIYLREDRSVVEGSKVLIHPNEPVQK